MGQLAVRLEKASDTQADAHTHAHTAPVTLENSTGFFSRSSDTLEETIRDIL